MAPRHYIGAVVDLYTRHASSRHLLSRSVPSKSLIATVVVVSNNSPASEKSQIEEVTPERKQSDWLRKNSNVLWSWHIEEDDLKAQFAVSPKSRTFSIGSVSTVEHGRCPLDRRSNASPLSQHKITDNDLPRINSFAPDLRIRTPFEHQTTPTKNVTRTRALSTPSVRRSSSSFEEAAKRKQSLPVPASIEEDFKEVDI
ncbi:hypothetical protein H2200_006697 [Cladophialophora chaetospira]|uniref:Uncharacterized protein n=1 Tax=Cladophialophora chaetospira TaxID=386627 RepID=A0AA38X8P3_9EURO|nr:hypothetical protein H2200_006697 [Cladophialophora chaetospira]